MNKTPDPAMPVTEWRCFHCDEVFTRKDCAEAHFGLTEDSRPACVIKAGAEGSLVRALRNAERDAADAWTAISIESTEAARAYYSQMTRHNAQLIAAEEAGYERGLADALATPQPSREGEIARAAVWFADHYSEDREWEDMLRAALSTDSGEK